MGGGAGDSGKVGGLSFGGGSKGPSKDKSKDKGNAAAPAKGEGKGFFGGLKDIFSGGAKSKSGPPETSIRPQARPAVVKTGTGEGTRYLDTKTGQSYAAPSYGAFSFKGLTSTDPANVARNRYGAERAMAVRGPMNDRDRGIASLVAPSSPVTDPVAEEPAAPTAAELAMIGAPTTPMAPTFVESPVYGLPGAVPAINYGNAFMGGPQLPPINLMDIFAAYPNFGMR